MTEKKQSSENNEISLDEKDENNIDHNPERLDDDEKIKFVESVQYVEELIEEVLPKIGVVSGGDDKFTPEGLKEIIHKVYNGKIPTNTIPRTYGLRSKVIALMKENDKVFFDESAHPDTGHLDSEDSGEKDEGIESDKDDVSAVESVNDVEDEDKEKTEYEKAREKYREYREKVKEAEEKFIEASMAYEEERKKTGLMKKIMATPELDSKKKEMERAQDKYDSLLEGLRDKRKDRIDAFLKKISDKHKEKDVNEIEKKSSYIARHEFILEKHIDNEVELLENLRSKENDKPESKYTALRAMKHGWNLYRKMPLKTRLAIGTGIGSVLGATAAIAGAGGVAAVAVGGAVGGGRRFFGMLTGTVTALETKRMGDTLVEKYAEHKLKKEHKEFAKKSLGQSRKSRLAIKKNKKIGKTVSTVAAGAAAYAAGHGISNAIGDLQNTVVEGSSHLNTGEVNKDLIEKTAKEVFDKKMEMPEEVKQVESVEAFDEPEITDLIKKLKIDESVSDNNVEVLPDDVDDSLYYDPDNPEVLLNDVDDSLYYDPDNPEVLPDGVDDSLYYDPDNQGISDVNSVPTEPTPENVSVSEKFDFKGVYENGSSIEKELQSFISDNDWVKENYPDLSHEEIGKIAHRIQLKMFENEDVVKGLNVHNLENGLVYNGDEYSVDIDKNLLQNEIESVHNKHEIVELSDTKKIEQPTNDTSVGEEENADLDQTPTEEISKDIPQEKTDMTIGLEEDLKHADEVFKEQKIDYLGLDTRPAIESFFKTEGVFDKIMNGKKHVVLSNWGPISHARLQDVFDGEGSITYTIGDNVPVEMGLETEQLTRSIVTQLEKGLTDKITDIDKLIAEARKDNITVGELVKKIDSELSKDVDSVEDVAVAGDASLHTDKSVSENNADIKKTQNSTISDDVKTEQKEDIKSANTTEFQLLKNYEKPKLEVLENSDVYGAVLQPVEISDEIKELINVKYLAKHPEWAEGTAGTLYDSARHSDFRTAIETQLVDIGIDLRGDMSISADKIKIDWSQFKNMTPAEALCQLEQHEKMIENSNVDITTHGGSLLGKFFGFNK